MPDASALDSSSDAGSTGASLIVTKTVVNNTGRPTGTPLFDIDVACDRGFTRRIGLPDGGQETVTGIANGALCTIKESPPPAPAGCAWTTTYPDGASVRVGTSARPNGPGAQQSSTAAPRLDVVNTLTCKGGGNGGAFGSLTIEKQIVVLGSIQPPVMPFTVDVACSPGGPTLPLTLDNSNGFRATVPGITPGSSCSFSERPPVVPLNYVQRGCSWSVAYPNGKTVGMPPVAQSALRRIVNTWRCGADGGGPTGGGGDEGNGEGGKTGSLTVVKEVVNDSPSFPPPNTTFNIVVACRPGGSQTVALNVGNNYRQTLTGLPLGATCTVTEQAPAVPSELSRRCHWATSYPDRQAVRVTGPVSVRVVNRWSCTKGDGGSGGDGGAGDRTGSLTIIKEVVNASPGAPPPPSASFNVVVTCQPGGSQTVTLNTGNGFHKTLTGLAMGATCGIVEQTPVVPPPYGKTCHWDVSYPAGQKAQIGDLKASSLRVVNRWTCDKGDGGDGGGGGGRTGALTITKMVINEAGSIPPPSTTFNVQVACQPGGSQVVALNAGNGFRKTLNGLPLGAACTVTEQPPAIPANLARLCSWETSYPDGQVARANDRRDSGLRVVNHWRCNKGDGGDGGKTGSLTIIKELINSSPTIPPVNTSFSVLVACQPGGTQTVVLNAANGFHVTLTGLPQGAICTITEQPPVVPSELARRCRWVTTYPAGQKAEVTDRRDLSIKVSNQWVCGTGS